jgi:hypothetical protein
MFVYLGVLDCDLLADSAPAITTHTKSSSKLPQHPCSFFSKTPLRKIRSTTLQHLSLSLAPCVSRIVTTQNWFHMWRVRGRLGVCHRMRSCVMVMVMCVCVCVCVCVMCDDARRRSLHVPLTHSFGSRRGVDVGGDKNSKRFRR